MLDVRVNLLKNRLYLTLDRLHRNKVDQSLPLLKSAAGKLAPGFTCIIRFVEIREPDPRDAAYLEKLDSLLSGFGMACVAHIGAVGCDRMPLMAENHEFTACMANTIEAAERHLDHWEKTSGSNDIPLLSN